MSIDSVRRTAPAPLARETGAPAGSSGAQFEVHRPAETAQATVPTPLGPLARLRSGDVDRAGYVDLHVEQATRHLDALAAPALEDVRGRLRELCESAPLFSELVDRASR